VLASQLVGRSIAVINNARAGGEDCHQRCGPEHDAGGRSASGTRSEETPPKVTPLPTRTTAVRFASIHACLGVPAAPVGLIDRSHSPRLSRVSFNRHFGAPMTRALCAERGTPNWPWPATSGSGPLALAMPCAQVPGRYAGPSNVKSRVAHPWSWDIGPSTSAAQTSLNVVHSRRKARTFGLSTKMGLQDNGRPSPKGTALGPGFRSMG
jgi:hypothetical protein